MDVEQLQEYRYLILEAQELEEEIKRLRFKSLRSSWTNGMPRGTSEHDKLGELVAKIDKLERLLVDKHKAIIDQRMNIEAAISQLESKERRLIRSRYVQGLNWEQVAEIICYSLQQTHRIHRCALDKMSDCSG